MTRPSLVPTRSPPAIFVVAVRGAIRLRFAAVVIGLVAALGLGPATAVRTAWAAPATSRQLADDAATAVVAPEGGASPQAAPPPEAGATPRGRSPKVAAVEVDLVIRRGGERRADGEKIPHDSAWVEGVARYTLERPASRGDRIVLIDFASSMPEEPTHLDEVALANYVDGPFDRGGTTLTGHWGAKKVARVKHGIVVELPAGASEFTLRYAIDVPHRYWPFGCVLSR